jgi:beta-N-acetylhexosaminidase
MISVLVLITILLGYNYFFQPFAYLQETQQQTATEQEVQVVEQISDQQKILEKLTPRQRVAMLLAVPLTIDDSFADPAVASMSSRIAWIQQQQPGTVTLFGSNVSTQSASTAIGLLTSPEIEVHMQPLIAVDHEGGTVQRLSGSGFSRLPSWQQLCRQNQVEAQINLEQSVEELEAVGIDVVFAPVVDVAVSNPALGSRVCSDNFELVESRAKLAANVYYQKDILPVFKHFPGIGSLNTDLHTGFGSVAVGEEEASLYRNILAFFNDKTVGVMISHAGVENQDSTVPCSLSSSCVGQLADNFSNVLIFSDDVLMDSAQYVAAQEGQPQPQQPSLEEIVLQTVIAGNDQVVMGPGVSNQDLDAIISTIMAGYESNNFIKSAVDQRVLNILEYKLGE